MIDIDLESLHDVEARRVAGRILIKFKSHYGERVEVTLSQDGAEWLLEELRSALGNNLDIAI